MTTNGDMTPRQRDEDEPLEELVGDVLDLVDETVARITDAEVNEHLRKVLNQSGYAGTEQLTGPAELGRSAASEIESLIRPAYKYAFRMLGNRADAKEAVLAGCVKVMRIWPRVSMLPKEQQRAFLLAVVMNEAVQIRRQLPRECGLLERHLAENTRITSWHSDEEAWIAAPEDLSLWIGEIRCFHRFPDILPLLGANACRGFWENLGEAHFRAILRDGGRSGDEPGQGMPRPYRF